MHNLFMKEIDGVLDTVSRINEYVGKAFTWANEVSSAVALRYTLILHLYIR